MYEPVWVVRIGSNPNKQQFRCLNDSVIPVVSQLRVLPHLGPVKGDHRNPVVLGLRGDVLVVSASTHGAGEGRPEAAGAGAKMSGDHGKAMHLLQCETDPRVTKPHTV